MTLQGWRITTLVTCLIVVGLLFNFGLAGWNAPAITHAIDATGRSSLILFAIAFTAQRCNCLAVFSLSLVAAKSALDRSQFRFIPFHPSRSDHLDDRVLSGSICA